MKHLMKTIALVMSTAIMLPAAGCANQQKQEGQKVIWEDGTVLHLTDQTDEPGMHGLSQTGSGMFYTVPRDSKSITNSLGFPATVPALKYFDAESGQSMYLCARPNCLHDGDAFCTATTENYEILSDPVFLDGYVYAIAHDCTEQLSQSSRKYTNVLLRYAADGTEITKIADLQTIPQEKQDIFYEANARLIAHRGQLWMKCAYKIDRDTSDSAMNVAEETPFGGYGMFVYAPADGTLTKIQGTDAPVQGFVPWNKTETECIIGLGDAVYFRKSTSWGDPLKGNGIFRIDCLTGETEELIKQKPSTTIYEFSAAGDKIVYCEARHQDEQCFQLYDLTTGEETILTTKHALAEAHYPDNAETAKQFLYNCSDSSIVSLLCDTSHVLIVLHSFGSFDSEFHNKSFLAVCGLDGKIEQTIDIEKLPNITDSDHIERYIDYMRAVWGEDEISPKEAEQMRKDGKEEYFQTFTQSYFHSFHYADGICYLRGSNMEYTLSLDGALNGNAEIKPLFLHTTY